MRKFLFEIVAICIGLGLIYTGSQAISLQLNSFWSAVLGAVVVVPLSNMGLSVHNALFADEEISALKERLKSKK